MLCTKDVFLFLWLRCRLAENCTLRMLIIAMFIICCKWDRYTTQSLKSTLIEEEWDAKCAEKVFTFFVRINWTACLDDEINSVCFLNGTAFGVRETRGETDRWKSHMLMYLNKLRPILNFAPRGKLWPPGAKLSPRGEFSSLGGKLSPGVKFSVRPSIFSKQ
jgi:hypothetical protein